MKIPPYIKNKQIKKTIEIANKIKKQEGISAYLFFKRLATAAMYGELIVFKITYNEFLCTVQQHINKKWNNSIRLFWSFDSITEEDKYHDTLEVYWIPKYIIKYGTQLDVEKQIYNNVIFSTNNIEIDKTKLQLILKQQTNKPNA